MSEEAITLLSKREIDKVRQVCRLAAELLSYLEPMVKSGVSTLMLNDLAEEWTQTKGATSAVLNYQGFPHSICTSVNEVVCNAIPRPTQILKEGDIINITAMLKMEGYYGKTSRTFFVGKPSATAKKLVEVTEECLRRGIAAVKPGAKIGDIGAAIQEYAESNGFSVVRDFVGHGIGSVLHAPPQIPHYGTKGQGKRLRRGMVFTIEPMINQGTSDVEVLADGWTVVTKDRQLSAQFEHTVAVTDDGVEILSLMEETKEDSSDLSQSQNKSIEIYKRLLKERIIFLGTEITDEVADSIVAQLLFLEAEDPQKEIYFYINSPGGSVYAGLAIYDTIQFLKTNVVTVCFGLAAGIAGILLAAGTTGKRLASPKSRIMFCQPTGGLKAGIDIETQAREILFINKKLLEIIAQHTGQPIEKIQRDTEGDFWLSAEEALEYGVIDQIIDKKFSISDPLVPEETPIPETVTEATLVDNGISDPIIESQNSLLASQTPQDLSVSGKPQSSYLNPYDVLEISPDTPMSEIPKAFTKAMKDKKYPADVIAKARKSLMNPKERIIADYLRPILPTVREFKYEDTLELEATQPNLELLPELDGLDEAIAMMEGVSEVDRRVGLKLNNINNL